MRTNTIYSSYRDGENWNRALVGEAAGLGLSIALASGVGLLLMPFGWILVLIAVGAAAVFGDWLGREIGLGVYDSTVRQFGSPAYH